MYTLSRQFDQLDTKLHAKFAALILQFNSEIYQSCQLFCCFLNNTKLQLIQNDFPQILNWIVFSFSMVKNLGECTIHISLTKLVKFLRNNIKCPIIHTPPAPCISSPLCATDVINSSAMRVLTDRQTDTHTQMGANNSIISATDI